MRLTAIHRYPIKGCQGHDLHQATVEPWGLAGDRRWLITDPDGIAITQRDIARLALLNPVPVGSGLRLSIDGLEPMLVPQPTPDPTAIAEVWSDRVRVTPAGAEADAWLGDALDAKVRLVWLDDPTRRPVEPGYSEPDDRVNFADGYPLLLANTSSLNRLNDWIAESGSEEGPLPMDRFRPNVVVSGASAFAEDEWIGRRIRIGAVTFRVPKPCGRCVVTTTNQQTGVRGHEPLRTLARYRKVDQRLLFGVNLIPDQLGEIVEGDEISLVD